MKFESKIWTIHELISIYEKDLLILDPPYQRNPIWSLKAQKLLINTIKKSQPMPNFFLLKKSDKRFEMVDGQQRARTIIAYWKGFFADDQGIIFDQSFISGPKNKIEKNEYLNYPLNITIINKLQKGEVIEAFYALVNSSGLRLNRPELKKAEYYNTNFLRLIIQLAGHPDFLDLKLFTPMSMTRMNNEDFVGELVALIKYGLSDKKEKVDYIFEHDITDDEAEMLTSKFMKVINHFKRFNKIVPICKTRFRQKNDFYSLFAFMHLNPKLKKEALDYYYNLLLKLARYIRPSQEECDPLMNYALNCVTQSNSKNARENRHSFFVDLFLNKNSKPNKTQKDILRFFRMKDSDMKRLPGGYRTLLLNEIHDPYQREFPFK